MSEEWRPVVGYETAYEVSSFGKVRTIGDGWFSSRELNQHHNHKVYLSVKLYVNARYPKWRKVHRLVLAAFVGPCPPGHEGSHLNGDSQNNHLDNLAWERRSTNIRRQREHGTRDFGSAIPNSKLTDEKVLSMRSRHGAGESVRSLAKEFKVSWSTAHYAISGVTWSHLQSGPRQFTILPEEPTDEMATAGARILGATMHADNQHARALQTWRQMVKTFRGGGMPPKPVNARLGMGPPLTGSGG